MAFHKISCPCNIIIITQRFYKQLIANLKFIANISDMSNLKEDNIASWATDCDGEKYNICLCTENAKAQMKFNS